MAERRADGQSFFDQPIHGWPRRRIIWSCQAERGPLVTRYYLLDTPWFAIYLHRLHTSDEDRALHDHPWSFVTFLISGGYWEHTPWQPPAMNRIRGIQTPLPGGALPVKTWRRRFSLLWRPALWQHRLELEQPVWTLVLRFRRYREWGFITPKGWLHWQEYGKEWCD